MPSQNIEKVSLQPLQVTYNSFSGGVRTIRGDIVGNFRDTYFALNRNSVTTPHFGAVKSDLPMNPFHFDQMRLKYASGWQRTTSIALASDGKPVYDNYYIGCFGGNKVDFKLASDSETASIDAQVRNEILNKIKDSKVNLTQLFAERQKTAQMVGDMAIRLAKALGAMKHGDIRGAADALGVKVKRGFPSPRDFRRDQSKAIAKGWLELQYGWKPLLSDVYGIAESIAREQSRPVTQKVVHSRTLQLNDTIKGDVQGTETYIEHRRTRTTIRYTCWFSASSSGLRSLAELGITNPALLAWELLPYSFVVDWFLPVGSYISTFDATNGLSFRAGCRTTFTKAVSERRITPYPFDNSGSRLAGDKASSGEYIICDRSPLSGFPDPGVPQFKDPFGFIHLANAMALLRSMKF